MTAFDPIRRFIGEPGRKTFGPYAECVACGAWKKDHGPNQECPENPTAHAVDG
jgi:hypothetical protein